MSGNTFGRAFRILTFGESHGPFIGVVIDGLKPGLAVDVEGIQKELNRRRPGQSRMVTPRNESDRVQIISGVFEGKTTGTPLCMLIANRDQRSSDYNQLARVFRPGHAGYAFLKKYGIFDYRGGGRASGRETATRVAAGAVAKALLRQRNIQVIGYTRQVADIVAESVDFSVIEKNPVRAPDMETARKMMAEIERVRDEGDSLGGVVEIVVKNCPAGLGEPVFEKLEADFAAALMSIGAVKAFEMGSGFQAARMRGSEHNDEFYFDSRRQKVATRTNNAGGVLGGISNGEELVLRIAVKPPSSIRKPQNTIDQSGDPVKLEIGGRHDPCICPRIVPVAEAMVALVLADHLLLQERISEVGELDLLREQIDTIDTHLLLLLAQRKNLAERIAHIKNAHALPVEDGPREGEVLAKWQALAEMLSLPSSVISGIVKSILKFSKNVQQKSVK